MQDSSYAIRPLMDHPECLPELAALLRSEWNDYYRTWSDDTLHDELAHRMSLERIPVGLIALHEDHAVGTIVLRASPIDSHTHLSPALGGLVVDRAHRGKGIGTALIEAGTRIAASLGHRSLYTATTTAHGLLRRLGWEPIKTIGDDSSDLLLYHITPLPL